MFVRSCIPQTRTRESGRESLSESNCQIWSTRLVMACPPYIRGYASAPRPLVRDAGPKNEGLMTVLLPADGNFAADRHDARTSAGRVKAAPKYIISLHDCSQGWP